MDLPPISASEIESTEDLLNQCDNLIDHKFVHESRLNFMTKAIDAYEHATTLLGYFSQLHDFRLELAQLSNKLMAHRKTILETYIDILPQETIKSLSIPSASTKLYQKGIHKFHRVKNYILYHYKQQLYTEMELTPKRIDIIRDIVCTIIRLDKHYDIYHELIVELQKKNEAFDQLMYQHLAEFIYI
jgi:hypothetical protein